MILVNGRTSWMLYSVFCVIQRHNKTNPIHNRSAMKMPHNNVDKKDRWVVSFCCCQCCCHCRCRPSSLVLPQRPTSYSLRTTKRLLYCHPCCIPHNDNSFPNETTIRACWTMFDEHNPVGVMSRGCIALAVTTRPFKLFLIARSKLDHDATTTTAHYESP